MSYLTEKARYIQPYVPGEQPKDGERYIKLNTNENPYPPAPEILLSIQKEVIDNLRLYPDPDNSDLCYAIARSLDVSPEQVFCSNGSDEVLAFSFQAFFSAGKPILFPDITYSFYNVLAKLYNVDYEVIPLDSNMQINICDYYRENAGIIFANPNAPTGVYLPVDRIELMAQYNMGKAVVIVDEAYIAFGGQSAVSLINQYPNLLVIRTFSKSHGLAGQRVGYAVGHADLIDGLNRIKNCFNSYTVDRIACVTALAALNSASYYNAAINKIKNTREWFTAKMRRIGFYVPNSFANFVFMKHTDISGACLYQYLKDNGILVRHFKQPLIMDFIRVTIGTDEDMNILTKLIKEKVE